MLPRASRKMFEPAPVPEPFDRLFPKKLMLRPIQLRASTEDAALMTPAVMELEQLANSPFAAKPQKPYNSSNFRLELSNMDVVSLALPGH